MDAAEKLSDLRHLHDAVKSQREAQLRLVTSRPYRKRRLANCIKRIRSLRLALGRSLQELLMLRGATNGDIDKQVMAYDARLAELRKLILHQEQRVRIEKAIRIRDQMQALGQEMPQSWFDQVVNGPPQGGDAPTEGDPDLVEEDAILS